MSYAGTAYATAPYAAPYGAATPAAPPAGNLPITELALEVDPGVWVDLAPDLVSASTRRGRNAESGAFETGRGFVTLRNEHRKYDPDNAAGPYYGKLRPNRRVRWRANYDGAVYPVMVGYVDRITQDYPGPNEIVATIAFSDRFKILNNQENPVSAYMTEVLADAPRALWRLDEPNGSTVVRDSSGNNYALDVTGTPTFGQPSMAVRDPGSSVLTTIGAGQNIGRQYVGNLPASGPPITLEILYQRTVDGADGGLVGIMTDPLTQGMFALATSSTIVLAQAVNGVNTQTTAIATGINMDDNAVHHLAAVWDASGALRVYVDGVDRTSGAPTCAPIPFSNTTAQVFAVGGFIPPGTGNQQMAAIYNTALSAARIVAHNAAARTPWNGDLPGPRLARVFGAAGIPATDYDVDAGTTTLQSTSLGGTILSYAQNVAETEIGALFVTRDGTIRFLARRAGLGENPVYQTPKAVLADEAPAAAEVPYRTVTLEVDESDIVTRATVSRDGSIAVTYQDAAAVAEFGVVPFTADGLLHNDDAYSSSYAQWIVNSRKGPETKVGSVEITPGIKPAVAYPAILGLELGDRVTLKRRPKTGAAITKECRLEAVSHTAVGKQWGITLQLSAFNQSGDLPVFIWGVTKWGEHVWGL